MTRIKFKPGKLDPEEQEIISAGFNRDTAELQAPPYRKTRLNWLMHGEAEIIIAALTADLLWDWIYIDELWVESGFRNQGLGRSLLKEVEEYAISKQVRGLWLWTQDWQAEDFYRKLAYEEFARFPDFPRGHHRIGFRKQLKIRDI